MSLDIDSIRQARQRIAPYIVETPLLRVRALDGVLGCRVHVKAECMQNTGSFKVRGAMSKVLSLSPEQVARGLVAASSGNHGRAVAAAAQMLGTSAVVVMPHTAAPVKVRAIEVLGAEVVRCDASERFRIARQICDERDATMVAPFDDEEVMAGQGTLGLEIAEQLPGVDAVVAPVSGGGLLGGIAMALAAVAPGVRIYGAEPALLARYGASLRAGRPVAVEPAGRSLADALVAQAPGAACFPCVQAHCAGVAPVEEEFLKRAWKLLLMEGKILCEPSSAIGIAAVLQGEIAVGAADVCFVVSGGNVAFDQLAVLADVE